MTERSSGILLPLFSLPSNYGIGTMGRAAIEFIDFLSKAGQRWWQVLPVGPTGFGDSPYQSFSTYAGNPYFIDLETLIDDGLLTVSECSAVDWGTDPARIDYAAMLDNRFDLLRLACDRGFERDAERVKTFETENRGWLGDYALFMALKRRFDMRPWYEWDDDIRMRRPEAIEYYTDRLAGDIKFFKYIQFLFFSQWERLREYAHEKGVGIIGDTPIYVALDSADVWSEPRYFLLDKDNVPIEVAGVPPDAFTDDGQLWGNPLYRWDVMKDDGYGWWIRKIGGAQKLYDMLRIDHFRAFESYWAVKYGAKTAKGGRWLKGPGLGFVKMLTSWFYGLDFIAEDLGVLTDDVKQMVKDSGLPGMCVLQFAFDPSGGSDYLPHRCRENSICYTGTHDNTTVRGWLDTADRREVAFAKEYLGLNSEEGFDNGLIRGGMATSASIFIAQMQDYLGLGNEARINLPGTSQGNWQWRMTKNAATDKLAARIRHITELYGRCPEDSPINHGTETVTLG